MLYIRTLSKNYGDIRIALHEQSNRLFITNPSISKPCGHIYDQILCIDLANDQPSKVITYYSAPQKSISIYDMQGI